MPSAIEQGLPMQGIETAAAEKQSRIDGGKDDHRLNLFPGSAPDNMEVLKVATRPCCTAKARLASLRAGRDEPRQCSLPP